MDIGKSIKKYRLEKGLSQKELAELIGCAEITIRQYESGKRQPRLDVLNRIAGALEMGVRRLYPDFSHEEWKTTETYKNAYLRNIKDPIYPELFGHYQKLNELGKEKALEHVEMLSKIPEYREE